MKAKGGCGPDLTTGRWKWGPTDAAILQNILTGIPGTQMPAFPMPEEDGRAIVAWLRSLRSAGPDEQVTEDPNASRCHMFGAEGGRLGPNLSAASLKKRPPPI